MDTNFDSSHYNSDAVSVDKVLIALASHYVTLEDTAAGRRGFDKEAVWRDCMQEWKSTHQAFAEEELEAWETLRKAELAVTQGYQISGLASECVSLITQELEDLDRKQESANARIEAAKGNVDSIKCVYCRQRGNCE